MIDTNKIIKLIGVFCFKIFLCISVSIALMFLLNYVYRWYIYERHLNKIEVIAEFNSNFCPDEYPLVIIIKNKSSKIIEHSTIYVKVNYKGHSNKLNDYNSFEDDRIIESGNEICNCWKVKGDCGNFLTGEDKEVKVTFSYFDFKD